MANFNWLKQWSDSGRKMGHSVFDLSKRMCFHLPNSLILPIRFIETVPDDHFQINMSGILRTETMNKAAFYNGKAVFTAFFVPYKQLWHNFNQFVVEKEDKHSVVYRDSACVPNIGLKELIDFVCLQFYYDVKDEFGNLAFYNSIRLLQFCKICNLYPLISDLGDWKDAAEDADDFVSMVGLNYSNAFDGRYVNMWRLLAYQHIFYDFYRNKYYDDMPFFQSVDPARVEYIDTFNVDNISCKDAASSHLVIDFGSYDENGYAEWSDAKLADILNIHYCQYRKDLYTSLLPSTQFGAVSGLSLSPLFSLSSTNQTIGRTNGNSQYNRDGYPSGVVSANDLMIGADSFLRDDLNEENLSHTHAINTGNLDHSAFSDYLNKGILPSSLDVLAFRRAELLQQWKQNALRAGNMVDDNFESHYGVRPYYEDDNNVRFLGQFECRLDVNPVTATADSTAGSNGKVGDIAAYGIGSVNGNNIDVQIKDFGVIVICAHFASEVYYSANGLDKQNTLIEPFDYFQSEFENAGLDSVSAWQQSLGLIDSGVLDMSFGYTPPYTMYKTEVDEVFGEYGSEYIHNDDTYDKDWSGSLSAWTVRRSDLLVDDGNGDYYTTVLPMNRFYQSPKLTNTIFGIEYDATGKTDPFGFAVSIDVKAIRPMSVLGIPIFG